MMTQSNPNRPEILAPAGSRASFLAALAAGADAIYSGLKQYSARMEAKNFSIAEIGRLVKLAHDRDVKVYITLNSLLKSNELIEAGRLIERLERQVKPDALIVQDLAVVHLAREAGFTGEIHLSTLANVSFSGSLALIRQELGIDRVVVPRELNIDEIKAMAAACPQGLALEVFVHGALCYGVSGRCYWSSFLGGKSGLRGRCVQPCRRNYSQQGQLRRYFSCQDLSLDVLVKILLSVPQVRAWKIEGRKKGPHYVYYTVKAYQMLRDLQNEPDNKAVAKKTALGLLAQSLGRPGTHYNLLPQRSQQPIQASRQTGSGLFVGKIQGSRQKPYLVPRQALLADDTLRVGYEDQRWHAVRRVGRAVPKQGRYYLKFNPSRTPAKGTPVFLTDRREPALEEMLAALEHELDTIAPVPEVDSRFKPQLPQRAPKSRAISEISVFRNLQRSSKGQNPGVWISEATVKSPSRKPLNKIWWWLPPVVWPQTEAMWYETVQNLLRDGAVRFVLNAPWQIGWFKDKTNLHLWAGPFCNIANGLAAARLKALGFSGVIVSPELGGDDLLNFPGQCPLAAGVVIDGIWPLCISRTLADDFKVSAPFASPRGETAWVQPYDGDYWVFPNWKIDLNPKRKALSDAGYSMLITLVEPIPENVGLKKRPGMWNWKVGLK